MAKTLYEDYAEPSWSVLEGFYSEIFLKDFWKY